MLQSGVFRLLHGYLGEHEQEPLINCYSAQAETYRPTLVG